jgi:hypothetical protein
MLKWATNFDLKGPSPGSLFLMKSVMIAFLGRNMQLIYDSAFVQNK